MFAGVAEGGGDIEERVAAYLIGGRFNPSRVKRGSGGILPKQTGVGPQNDMERARQRALAATSAAECADGAVGGCGCAGGRWAGGS